jgi:hypothetical protein
LVAQVGEAGREPVAEHGEDAEHHVAFAGLIRRDQLGFRPGVDVDQAVQDVQRVAQGARHDHLPDPHHLLVYGVEGCEAAFVAEVLR